MNLLIRFLSFLIPLLGISIWAAFQRNYPMFLLIGLGLPALLLSLMGEGLFELVKPVEMHLLYPAIFWPMAVAG